MHFGAALGERSLAPSQRYSAQSYNYLFILDISI
jgi:hypothetical protein